MPQQRKPGESISHYVLIEQLGAGGMGIVFKAQDQKLDRYAALKFLPAHLQFEEEEKQRFLQEAKLTSALDHPNICTIYEIDETDDGQMFIAMACYEGENLRERLERGPFQIEEAIRITSQICEGLSKAHDRGIIHRDMKPDNVILTNDNIVKIVDFGISRLAGGTRLTKPGTVIGTPFYMSPEQIKGEEVDHRTDLWSTGVLFYNMLTCSLPFSGDTDLSLMYCVVNEDPRPIGTLKPETPDLVLQFIEKALQKDPSARYQSAREMLLDLQSWNQSADTTLEPVRKTSRERSPSIAVLQFRDMSPQQDQGYLSEGLAEAVTTTLTRIQGLRVVSRNSILQLIDQGIDPTEIGRKLRVEKALQGTIRRAGDRIRVSTQLMDLEAEYLIWAEDFEQDMNAIFELEDEISRQTVEALKAKEKGIHDSHAYRAYTDDSEAYTAYLKGRYHWNRRTVDDLKQSIGYFTDAIDIDSGFASAYAGLADAQIILGLYGAFSAEEVMPRAKDAASRALSIDEGLAEAHVSLGCIEAVYSWNWQEAEREFIKGIELNRNYATAHHWYSVNHLVPLGRFEEAQNEIREALQIDPVSLAINSTLGLTHYFAGEFDEAIQEFERTLEMDPSFPMASFFLARAYSQKSMFEEALALFRKALDLYGESPNILASYGHTAALAGESEIAQETLSELLTLSDQRYVSSYDLAIVLLGLGRHQEAMERLGKAVLERSYPLVYLNVDPVFDSLRGASEFQSLSNRVFGGFSTIG